MSRICSAPLSKRQGGAALLVFMLVFFLAATSWVLEQDNATRARDRLDGATASVMAQAKDALIGRAASDNQRPGSLPCPDRNNNGEAEALVGNNCPAYVGRLPWKTLGMPELRDGNGDGLWYALSSSLRDDDSAQPINAQTALELTLDGMPDIAAIIFSPGAALANQNRRPGNQVTDYLDGGNKDGDSAYVSGPPSTTFNDKALPITRTSLFRAVNRRILTELTGNNASGLARYYRENGNNYPLPSANLQTELTHNTILDNNAWHPLVAYQVNANRQEAILTIAIPTTISCAIEPKQTSCAYP